MCMYVWSCGVGTDKFWCRRSVPNTKFTCQPVLWRHGGTDNFGHRSFQNQKNKKKYRVKEVKKCWVSNDAFWRLESATYYKVSVHVFYVGCGCVGAWVVAFYVFGAAIERFVMWTKGLPGRGFLYFFKLKKKNGEGSLSLSKSLHRVCYFLAFLHELMMFCYKVVTEIWWVVTWCFSRYWKLGHYGDILLW